MTTIILAAISGFSLGVLATVTVVWWLLSAAFREGGDE